MSENLKNQTIFGLIWKFLERMGTQGISFVVSIVLARLLAPADYGAISLITVFITLANVFAQCGFGKALIQRKDVTEDDFSSVLLLSSVISVALYAILFFAAPFIASFYDMPILSPVLRVLSLRLFLTPLNSVQEAIVSRNMEFKKLFFRSMGATLPSGVIGIIMAYMGFGVWALVAQQLTNQIFICVVMWFSVHWRPKFVFQPERVKILFSYGWKLLASSLINTLYQNIRSLIIGKLYTPEMLGVYNRGWQFPSYITSNIDGSIQSVMLPTLSKVQDEKERAKAIMRRSVTMSSFLIFPLMAGLAACAEPITILLLTEKWLPSVPYIRIFAVVYAFLPVHTANLQAINALGRSDIYLKLEVIKKIIGIIIILLTIPFGVFVIALGGIFNAVLSTFINAYPNKTLLNYSYVEQLKDLIPQADSSSVMFVCVYFITKLSLPVILMLVLQVVVGIAIYVLLAFLMKNECLFYTLSILKKLFNRRREL